MTDGFIAAEEIASLANLSAASLKDIDRVRRTKGMNH
jgi:hypothetical protein